MFQRTRSEKPNRAFGRIRKTDLNAEAEQETQLVNFNNQQTLEG